MMMRFADLVSSHEDWLMHKVLAYAKENGYTRYTATLAEAWRKSISGLSQSLLEYLKNQSRVPELLSYEDYANDPVAAFGIIEAKRHRRRGVSLGMFLGFMKCYRQSYIDLVVQSGVGIEEERQYRSTIDRFFDRIEIGFCTEWNSQTENRMLDELQSNNRCITNEKNKYRTIFESISSPVFLLDDENRIVDINHAASELFFGIKVPGSAYYEKQKKGESLPWLADELAALDASTQKEVTFEKQVQIGKQVFQFQIKVEQMLDFSEKFSGKVVVLNDVTDRKQKEETILRAKEDWERTFDSIPDLIAIIDNEYRIVRANKAMATRLGVSPEECVGLTCYHAVHGTTEPPSFCPHRLLIEDGIDHAAEVHEDRLGGDFMVSVSPRFGPEGKLAGSVHVARDVTERKQMEENLRRSREKYYAIFENSILGLYQSIPEGRYISVNPALAKLFGYSSKEEMIASVTDIGQQLYVNPQDRDRAIKLLLEQGFLEGFEFEARRKDGTTFWLSMNTRIVQDENGLHFDGTVEDITKRKLADEALQDSESKLASIIEFLPDATFVIDSDKRVIAWNRAIEDMTGVKKDDMIGKGDHAYTVPFYGERRGQLLDLLEVDDKDLVSKYQYVKRKGNTLCAETFTPALNGGKGAYVWATGAPLFDNEGNRIGAIESIRDITEYKRIERTLQEQLNFLQQLIDSIPNPIFYKDTLGVYLGCNKAFEALTGIAKDKTVGHTVYELYSRDLADIYYKADNKLFRNPGTQVYEAAVAHADGSRHDVMYSKATYFDTEGRLAGLVGVILDITERKRMEDALRESERRLADIIDFLPDATVVIDKEGKVIAWNRAIEKMTGIKAEEILGKGDYEYSIPFYGERRPILVDLVLKPREEIEELYSNIKREGGYLVGEAYMPTLGGGNTYLWGVASALYDSRGNIVGAIESIKDITDRKRAEEALQNAHDELDTRVRERTAELETRNAEMERFIYTVSHELRSPLISISGFLGLIEMAAQKSDLEQLKNDLRIVSGSVSQMDRLLQSTLELSRIGRVISPPENVPFGEIIGDALSQTAEKIESRGVKVSVAQDMPIVHVDRMRIVEVLVNLIENSIKYMGGQQHPKIEIGQMIRNHDIAFFVRDNGIGLDPTQHDKVFGLFYKVDKKTEGTGAGLAIVKRIIEVHGGRIWIESELGKGCTVCFTLPLA